MQLVEENLRFGTQGSGGAETAYGSTLDSAQVKQAGFAAVLSKPLSHEQVIATLAQVAGRLQSVQPPKK
jgi:hypothetical protein